MTVLPVHGTAGPVAIVAHDAGGAEVLSSYVRQQELDYRLSLQGPARAIFERKLGPFDNLSVAAALQGSSSLLCATSWQSDLELQAIEMARAAGTPSVAWLDHWVNYRERFTREGRICLPNEVWVSDACALTLARQHLPELLVSLQENPYFADIRVEIASATPRNQCPGEPLSVLYVCEPVREPALRQFGNALHWGYTEESAMRYFLDNVGALGSPVGRILVRPHPSEPPDKYTGVIAGYPLAISLSSGHSLITEIASSDCVVGCGSMAMVIGLMAGKRVLSCIPPGGPACSLPQREIECLQTLAA